MKIVILADSLKPEGGAASVGRHLVKMLKRAGIPTTALIADQSEIHGIETLSLDMKDALSDSPLRAVAQNIFNPTSLRFISNYIDAKDTHDTIYVVNSWYRNLSPSIFCALERVAERCFIFAHDYFLVCPNGAFFLFPGNKACALTPLSAACLLSQCDKRNYAHKMWRVAVSYSRRHTLAFERGFKVIAVHDLMSGLLERGGVPAEAILAIPNPVSPLLTSRVEAERNTEILFVGALSAEKGLDVLMAAAARRHWHVHIFGNGPLADIAPVPGVTFHGYQSHEVIGAVARRCRFLVMPSKQRETFGLAAVEALSCGLPVIASTQMLISEQILAYDCGLILPEVTADRLLEACDRLAGDDVLTKRLSENAFAFGSRIASTEDEWFSRILAAFRKALAVNASAQLQPHSPVPAKRSESIGGEGLS